MSEEQKPEYTGLDLTALLRNELAANEQAVDVKDKSKIRYALYARKSTEGEDRQEKSIEDQIDDCYENIIKKHKIKINEDDHFIDKKSAKISGNRPAFKQMIKAIKKGKYEGIICWHYDRLARNMKEAGEIIDMIDNGTIIDLQLTKANFENTPNGKMILGINFVLSKHYSDHLSESVLRGNNSRTANGTILNHIIHGYQITEDRHLVADGKNWEIIRRAFRMRIDEDRSQQQIAEYLNKSGYNAFRLSKGHHSYTFTVQDVSKLFKTPIYAGIHTYGQQVVKLSTLDAYKDFEPMIAEEEYIEMNQNSLVHSGFLHRSSRAGRHDVSNFLRKFVICQHCDHTMTTSVTTRKKGDEVTEQSFRFRCENKGCPMRGKGPAGSLLRDYVVEFLKNHSFATEDNYRRYLSDRSDYIKEQAELLESQKKSLEMEVAKNKRAYDNALANAGTADKGISKHYTPEYLDSQKTIWEKSQKDLKDIKAEIKMISGAVMTLHEFLELYKNTGEILRLTTSMSLADEIIKIFFSNITIAVTKETLNAKQKQWSVVDHCLREPFDKLSDSDKFSNGRGDLI